MIRLITEIYMNDEIILSKFTFHQMIRLITDNDVVETVTTVDLHFIK